MTSVSVTGLVVSSVKLPKPNPVVSAILNLGRSPGALRAHIPPAGVYSGLRRPVLSLRDQGAAPPLRLGVLALPGDGGHLTDFVANLWSIGAIDTTHKTSAANPWFLPPAGATGGA